MITKKLSAQKNDALNEEHEQLLRQAAEVAHKLDSLPPEQPQAKPQIFTLSMADGKALTACQSGERPVAEFLLTALHRVLAPGSDLSSDTVSLLQAAQAILLSAEPKSAWNRCVLFSR